MKKNILWFAVVLLTAFVGVSCSNEDILSEVPTPNPSKEVAENIVTFTATLDAKGGSGMRAVSASGATTWVENEEILISYKNTSNVSQEAKATVKSVDANGKATITAPLVDPKDGCEVNFYYPYESWKMTSTIDFASGQDGTLSTLSQYFDRAMDDSYKTFVPYTLSVSGGVATLPSGINMVNQNVIWKLSFTDGTTTITSAITKLEIHASAGGTTDYTITPTTPITDYFYVAMGDLSNDDIVITAYTSTGMYRRAKSNITLEMGKIYTTTGLALTKVEVGKVIGADGNIYADADAATTAGATARAMITYVGNDNCESAPYNHGLALALSDANGGSTCQWKTSRTDAGHTYKQTSENSNFIIESGLQYNAMHDNDEYPAFKYAMANNGTAAPTGCSAWFLASGYQWKHMVNACKNVLGTKNSYWDLRDGFSGVGGTNLQSSDYWSSTESGTIYGWECFFGPGSGFYVDLRDTNFYVRSALAF